mgnify:FL=1
MSFENFLQRLDKVANLVQGSEFLSKDSFGLQKEHGIKTSAEFEKDKAELEKAGRLLKIGILGRVKAGKSSFLNALIFNGESILPKAATPMTAALTVLEYAKTPSLSVDFYSDEDLSRIETLAKEFESELEKNTDAKINELKDKALSKGKEIDELELKEKARKSALQELKGVQESIYACYQQYQQISQSQVSASERETNKDFQGSLSEIRAKLKDYVGSSGKFMPFTKSITLRLDNEFLKDVQIIDTPGLNDPVPSRSARTNEILRECDAVLVLSPAGQFMDQNDVILVRKLAGSVARIFVIASKGDSELYGSEKDKNGGILNAVFEGIQNTLERSKNNALQKADVENNVLQRALKEKMIVCASICAGIVAKRGENLDEMEIHTLNRLKEEYPNDFQGEKMWENLSKLANIEALNAVFVELKKDKELILQERISGFLQSNDKALNAYKETLQDRVRQRIDALQKVDIDGLKARASALQEVKERGESVLDSEWNELCVKFCSDIRGILKDKQTEFFEKLEGQSQNEVGESIEKTHYLGIFEKNSYIVKQVNANAVINAIEKTCERLENLLNDETARAIQAWREKMPSTLLKALREEISDEFIDGFVFKKCLRDIFNKITYPSIKYSSKIPYSISGMSGILKDSAEDSWGGFGDDKVNYPATHFINEVSNFTRRFKQEVREDIDKLANELSSVFAFGFGKDMFQSLSDEIQSLQKDLASKALKLDEYKTLERSLENALL